MNKVESFMNGQQFDDLNEVVLTAYTPVPAVTLAGAAGVTGVIGAYALGRAQGGGNGDSGGSSRF